ncbi:RAxF-45 family protein [Cytobacillus oceanisediminis]|uniref:Uncharacterized protein n=1 Tax=Cytobacillus oceanisediminis TaxID=665099 RepID=A0A562JWX9_9BACI|nr:RAxF-45 family protein [Cytobacillus oceanisediminis]TWH87700.1 hypothetical protein IQ19_01946 [Cytobacillus oceanisediminis]
MIGTVLARGEWIEFLTIYRAIFHGFAFNGRRLSFFSKLHNENKTVRTSL